jgi:hypothetical protein
MSTVHRFYPCTVINGMTTRGHGLELVKRKCRTQLRQNFFDMRIVNLWNSLPDDVVKAPTVNCFKGRFDRYNADNRYSTEWTDELASSVSTIWQRL